MSSSELMSIGSFARRSGLTASALRFYADLGLLRPVEVDGASGYRLYAEDQLERALLLKRLREIGMPLASVESVLHAEGREAMRLIDEHVHVVTSEAVNARKQGAAIKAALATSPPLHIATVSGPVFTTAIDQVLAAATRETDIAALHGVFVEVECGVITVTATDRYRLATRTLMPLESTLVTWAATLHAGELCSALADLRRVTPIVIEAGDHEIWFRVAGDDDVPCRLLSEPYPDYRLMLASLAPVTTRVALSKLALLQALEQQAVGHVGLEVSRTEVAVRGSDRAPARDVRVPARVDGEPISIWFELATLYPALSTAIGADVLLDLRAADQPVTVRSADHGDLTTLAMPIAGG